MSVDDTHKFKNRADKTNEYEFYNNSDHNSLEIKVYFLSETLGLFGKLSRIVYLYTKIAQLEVDNTSQRRNLVSSTTNYNSTNR